MGKKAFITGITGFAGSFLSEELLRLGYEVGGTKISDDAGNVEEIKESLQLFKVNLLEKQAVLDSLREFAPDYIFHLAALTSPAESFKDPVAVFTNNISAQLNLFDAVRELDFHSRILITSSAEVYGMVKPEDLPINETVELRPGSPYAVSKIAQDYLALQYHLTYGMDIIRVRPFNHTGPRQAPGFVVPAFAKQIAEIEKYGGSTIKVGNLEAKRDFSDVRDMVKAYIALVEKGESGEVYNAGSGVSHKISEILDMLLSNSSKEIQIEEDPERMRPSDTPDIVSDNSKIELKTGWKPEIPIKKTLKDTLDYFRANV